jgi:hypothetical protein
MKCYAGSRVKTNTGGWSSISFILYPVLLGRTNQVGWGRLGQAARITAMGNWWIFVMGMGEGKDNVGDLGVYRRIILK